MIYVRVDATIQRRPAIVWGFLTNVSLVPSWVEGAVAGEIASEEKSGVGMRVDVTWRLRGRRYDATCEVSMWREHEALALETRVPEMLILDRATLEPVHGGTRLVVTSELLYTSTMRELFARPAGLLGATGADPLLHGAYERSVTSFKKLVESRTERPYR